jgi:hypothetical protein
MLRAFHEPCRFSARHLKPNQFAENAGVGWMAVPWYLPDLASLKGGDPVVQAFRTFAVDAKRRFTQRIILYRE